MELSFAEAVLRWHDFYALIGTAAATLLGLLFVSVSLHIDVMAQADGNEARILATQTFTSFVYVLLTALLFLIPYQNPFGLSLPLLFMGMLGCIGMVQAWRRFWHVRQKAEHVLGSRYLLWRFTVPTASYLALTAVSLVALRGRAQSLIWLLLVVLFLLSSATRSAWDLLLLLATDKRQA